LGVEGGDGFLAGGVFEDDLPGVVVHVAADAEDDGFIFDGDGAGVFVFAMFEIVAGVAAGLHIHASGVDALGGGQRAQLGADTRTTGRWRGKRNFHFEVDIVVSSGGRIVDHGFDANFV